MLQYIQLRGQNMKFAKFLEYKLALGDFKPYPLAKKMNINQKSVYRWLSGDVLPDPDSVILLKEMLPFEKGEVGEMLAAWINDRGLSNVITLFIQERVIDPLN